MYISTNGQASLNAPAMVERLCSSISVLSKKKKERGGGKKKTRGKEKKKASTRTNGNDLGNELNRRKISQDWISKHTHVFACKQHSSPSNAQCTKRTTLYQPKKYITRTETGINEEKKNVGTNICRKRTEETRAPRYPLNYPKCISGSRLAKGKGEMVVVHCLEEVSPGTRSQDRRDCKRKINQPKPEINGSDRL